MKLLKREILTVDGAAEFLSLSPWTIREKARLGEIPARKVGGQWRFSRRDLIAHIEGTPSVHELAWALRAAHRTLVAISEDRPASADEALEVVGEVLARAPDEET